MTKEKVIYWRPGGTLVSTTLSSSTTPSGPGGRTVIWPRSSWAVEHSPTFWTLFKCFRVFHLLFWPFSELSRLQMRSWPCPPAPSCFQMLRIPSVPPPPNISLELRLPHLPLNSWTLSRTSALPNTPNTLTIAFRTLEDSEDDPFLHS